MYVLYSRNTWREEGFWWLRRGRQNVTKGDVQKQRAILVMMHTACDRGQWRKFKTWYTNFRFFVRQGFLWLRVITKYIYFTRNSVASVHTNMFDNCVLYFSHTKKTMWQQCESCPKDLACPRCLASNFLLALHSMASGWMQPQTAHVRAMLPAYHYKGSSQFPVNLVSTNCKCNLYFGLPKYNNWYFDKAIKICFRRFFVFF